MDSNKGHEMKSFRQYLKEDAASRVKAAQEFEARTGISPEDFEAYEDVRQSGVTNMFDFRTVMELTGLSKDMIILQYIIKPTLMIKIIYLNTKMNVINSFKISSDMIIKITR